jgi:hypothetical protein
MLDPQRHEQVGGRQDNQPENDRLGGGGADIAQHDLEAEIGAERISKIVPTKRGK